uniref:asparagine synthase (glutamine-hydrolyzing) n=1 Tax=candidate division CPR3 bacterium TaxID=2268181 RepID=A0A7C5YRF0_UNCC3
MIFTEVKNNAGFKWYENRNVLAKGFLFDEEGNFYKNDKISSFFKDVVSIEGFKHKLQVANGSFAVIVKNEGQIFAAVDTLRSMPLFYIRQNGTLFVSDDGWLLARKVNLSEVDEISFNEFLLSGYTIGNHTLLNNLRQIQAGQYLYYNDETQELKIDFYYKHLHGNYFDLDKEEYFEKLDSIYKNVFSRLIKSVRERTIAIPLSGGYDSRSIAAMLKKFGYENVICFTYGRPESFEVHTSERVAKEFGYKWYFVNYADKDDWYKLIGDEKYLFFASNASSLPHVQEYIALYVLKSKSLVPEDAVFVPGFSGDLLGGSYVPNEIITGQEYLLFEKGVEDYIFSKYLNLDNNISVEHIAKIKERISKELLEFGVHNVNNALDFDSIVEAFFTNHKVAKFVVNAVRLYEYFGYDWRMPLWDKELYEFYYRIPLEYRIVGKNLYNDYLLERLFAPLGVGFRKRTEVIRLRRKLVGYSKILNEFWNLVRSVYWKLNPNKKGLIDFNAFSNLYAICKEQLSLDDIYRLPPSTNKNSIFALWFVSVFLKNAGIFTKKG